MSTIQSEIPQPNAGATTYSSTEPTTLSVASLVLGLASIVAGWTFFAPIAGLVCGIIALSREPKSRTMAIWGIVLSAVMLAGTVIVGILIATLGLAFLPFAFL